MTENNVILEDSAISIRAVRDDLPAQTVAEEAADFRLG